MERRKFLETTAIVLVGAGATSISASASAQAVSAGGDMDTQVNVVIVTALYAAFGRGDLVAILAALSEDIVWYHPPHPDIPWGGRRQGKQEVAQFFASLSALLDVEQFEVREVFARGDRVMVLGQEKMKVKKTGRAYALVWVHAWTFREDKVMAYHEYTETAPMIEALRQT